MAVTKKIKKIQLTTKDRPVKIQKIGLTKKVTKAEKKRGTGKYGKCEVCKQILHLELSMPDHYVRNHPELKKYPEHKCSDCDYSSAHKTKVSTHIRRIHNKCEECNLEFETKTQVKEHFQEVHPETWDRENLYDLHCTLCDFVCRSKPTMESHKLKMHSQTENLDVHQKIEKKIEKKIYKFECHLCNFKCKTQRILSAHKKRGHKQTAAFDCTECIYTTKSYAQLEKHFKKKHESGAEVKKIVPKLKAKVETKTETEPFKEFTCGKCDFSTDDVDALEAHFKDSCFKIKQEIPEDESMDLAGKLPQDLIDQSLLWCPKCCKVQIGIAALKPHTCTVMWQTLIS